MNWSALEVADVPPGETTERLTTPAEPLGLVAVMDVALFTVKLVAAEDPNLTPVAAPKLDPVTVTVVPPPIGPAVGETLVTIGTGT